MSSITFPNLGICSGYRTKSDLLKSQGILQYMKYYVMSIACDII
jgi:hypothetical protein